MKLKVDRQADALYLTLSEAADGESVLLTKIAEMPEPDRIMPKRLHAILKASAPALSPDEASQEDPG